MYRSPFRLIPGIHLPADPGAARRILLLEKKKLMAEFELSGAATIPLNGREVHRQDIISLFDELSNPANLSYHLAIWQDPALLKFLEEADITSDGRWLANPLYDDPGFRQFVSPYFAKACNAFMQRALTTGGVLASELQALQINKSLLLPADTEAAYRYATRFYTEKKNELLAISYRAETDEEVSPTEIGKWCGDHHIHLLNRLPGTFAALRYTLANILNNLCVVYDHKKKNDLALAAIERAATIKVDDEELNRLIPSNLGIIRSKVSRGVFNVNPSTGKKSPKIGLIIAIFDVIIRMVGCFLSNDDKPTYHGINDIPSFPSLTTESLLPKPRLLTYHSLLKGLLVSPVITAADTILGLNTDHLKRPSTPGDNIFRDLALYGFAKDSTVTGNAATSTLLVNNLSTWDAILIYQVGDTEIRSCYVPPKAFYNIRYNAPRLTAQLYAGSLWSDTVMHAFQHYVTQYFARKHILLGGYTHRARLLLEDTTGEPMFTRLSEEKPHHDTLNLIQGIGTYDIHPVYNLDSD
jgi:hypothetical protein